MMSGDETIDMRDGEGIDADRLCVWLTNAVPGLVDADARLVVRQYPSGFSNLTYRVTIANAKDTVDLVLRRPPRGVTPGIAHNVGREHDLLAALHPLGIPVARPLARCDDADIIGAPFYLMAHVDGVILRGSAPASLPSDPAARVRAMHVLSQTFVETLAQLHAVDSRVGSLASLGKPDGYVQRQVDGWTTRWQASRTDNLPDMDRVAKWLDRHRPPDRGASLIHNDFKFDNPRTRPRHNGARRRDSRLGNGDPR